MSDSNLLVRIQNSYDCLTKREKYVADYVLAQPKDVLSLSITDLADRCGVGDTTVFRFCRSLQLSGYQDFKMSLAMSTQTKTLLDIDTDWDVALAQNSTEVVQRMYGLYQSAAQAAFHMADAALIEQVAGMMLEASAIHVFGFGGSGVAAMMMHNKFSKIIPHIFYVADSHMQLTTASLLRPGDMCLIFSNSGITIDCIKMAQLSREAHAPCVFATAFLNTPAAKYADIILPCGSAEDSLQGGSISVLTSQLFTIDALYAEFFRRLGKNAPQYKERSAQAIVHKMIQ